MVTLLVGLVVTGMSNIFQDSDCVKIHIPYLVHYTKFSFTTHWINVIFVDVVTFVIRMSF